MTIHSSNVESVPLGYGVGKLLNRQLGTDSGQDHELPEIIQTSIGEQFTLFLDHKGSVWFSGEFSNICTSEN